MLFWPEGMPALSGWVVLCCAAVGVLALGWGARLSKPLLVLAGVLGGAAAGRAILIDFKILTEPLAAYVLGAVVLGTVCWVLSQWVIGLVLSVGLAVSACLAIVSTSTFDVARLHLGEKTTFQNVYQAAGEVYPQPFLVSLGIAVLASCVMSGLLTRFSYRHAKAAAMTLAGLILLFVPAVIYSYQQQFEWMKTSLGTHFDAPLAVLIPIAVVSYLLNYRTPPVAKSPESAAQPAAKPPAQSVAA